MIVARAGESAGTRLKRPLPRSIADSGRAEIDHAEPWKMLSGAPANRRAGEYSSGSACASFDQFQSYETPRQRVSIENGAFVGDVPICVV